MSDVFLSHNSDDKPAVEALALRLRVAGLEPWLDKWNLIPGNPWQEEIEQALDACQTCAVFIGVSGIGPWQNAEMRAAINRRVNKGNFRVVPVLLPGAKRDKRSNLPTFLTATTWVEFRDTLADEDAFHRLLAGIRGIAPGAGAADNVDTGECPYRGLQVFDVDHAPLFFGRSALTEWLLDKIRPEEGKANRFLAMLGASGSGKSSLARAGLLAQLERGALPDSQHWVQVILRPGAKPLESLAIALCSDAAVGKGQHPAELIKLFREHEAQLHWLCLQALHGQPDTRRVVVLIDQFEEIFTHCAEDAERQAFINNLLTAATDVTGQTIVLLTLRADFYGKCAAYPQLAAALSDDQFLISPMTEEELREAIVTPAQLVGCELEPGLVEVLLQDVENQPGSLPLLEYTLTRLWEQRRSRMLRLADYQALGGLEGALNQRADEIYAALPPEQQTLCQQIFLRLVQPGEGTEDTRRRASLSEFGDNAVTAQVISKLADARLITTQQLKGGGHAFAEVAHEALIRNWSQLRGWIELDRESLRTQHQISQSAEEWEQSERDLAWLLTGSRLQVAEEWLAEHPGQASPLERELIRTSTEQSNRLVQEKEQQQQKELEQARRRTLLARWLTAVTTAGLIIALLLAGWAYVERKQRTKSLLDSTLTHASLLSKGEDFSQARTKLDFTRELDPDIPVPRRHARDLLAGFTEIMGGAAEYTYQDGDKPLPQLHGGVAISPDGHWLAASGERGTIALFERDSRKLVQKLEGHKNTGGVTQGAVFDIVFHSKQSWLYSCGEDGQIIRWQLPEGGQPARLLQQWSEDAQDKTIGISYALALTPDGKVLASGHVDGNIRLWQADNGKLLRVLEGHSGMIGDNGGSGLAFSPDGKTLASASHDNTVRLWDWEKGESLLALTGHYDVVTGVAFSPDGQWLASSSADQSIILWDAPTGKQVRRLKGHQNMVFGLQFLAAPSRDRLDKNLLLASASSDRTIRLWDVETGITRRILQGHTATVLGLALWHAQGQDTLELYSASNDGTVKHWGVDFPQQWLVDLPESEAGISSAVSPDGKYVVVGLGNGDLLVYATPGWVDKGSPPSSKDAVESGGYRSAPSALRLVQEIKGAHDNQVLRLAFNNNGFRLASGSHDHKAKIWKFSADGKLTLERIIEGHENSVYSVTFSLDGSQLATASYDGRIGLFALEGEGEPPFEAHKGYVESVSFDPSGKQLLSAGNDDFALKLWDLTTQPPTAKTIATANDSILWASFSPDGTALASVGREQTVSVYPISGNAPPLRLNGHEQTVYKAIFSPDSRQLATVSSDMSLRLWDLDTQSELFRLRLPEEVKNDGPWDFDFRCTPTGCWIAVPLTSGKLTLYNLGKVEYGK